MKQDFQNEQSSVPELNVSLVDQDTKNKIRKHLSDQNDVITEDDIKNIRTDIFMIQPVFSRY